jgi:hypothetical protein
MTSLKYNTIYSRLFSKIEAYDFIELSEDNLNELLCDWIHSASANPYVRRLFKTFSLDDEIQEISYEMKYSVDEFSDAEFVTEILTLGVVVAWLEPKVNSINNIAQMFGSKEEKFYSQSQHLSELRALVNDSKKQQRRMIADRGYAWNSYLDGE